MLSVRAATAAAIVGLALIPALAKARVRDIPYAVAIDRAETAPMLPGVADLARVRAWLDLQSRSN